MWAVTYAAGVGSFATGALQKREGLFILLLLVPIAVALVQFFRPTLLGWGLIAAPTVILAGSGVVGFFVSIVGPFGLMGVLPSALLVGVIVTIAAVIVSARPRAGGSAAPTAPHPRAGVVWLRAIGYVFLTMFVGLGGLIVYLTLAPPVHDLAVSLTSPVLPALPPLPASATATETVTRYYQDLERNRGGDAAQLLAPQMRSAGDPFLPLSGGNPRYWKGFSVVETYPYAKTPPYCAEAVVAVALKQVYKYDQTNDDSPGDPVVIWIWVGRTSPSLPWQILALSDWSG